MDDVPAEWVTQVRTAKLVSIGTQNQIALANMLVFQAEATDIPRLSETGIGAFIGQIFETYKSRLGDRGETFWFYSWFDAMSGTLRCSAAPAKNTDNLPFGCRLKVTHDAAVIAKEAASSRHLAGIPWEELSTPAPGAAQEKPNDLVLTVFALPLGSFRKSM